MRTYILISNSLAYAKIIQASDDDTAKALAAQFFGWNWHVAMGLYELGRKVKP